MCDVGHCAVYVWCARDGVLHCVHGGGRAERRPSCECGMQAVVLL